MHSLAFVPGALPRLPFRHPSHRLRPCRKPLLQATRPPTCALTADLAAAAAAALTVALSTLPLRPPSPNPALANPPTYLPSPPSTLVVSHPAYPNPASTAPTVAVVGVAKAAIHDYHAPTATLHHSEHDLPTAHEPHHSAFLAQQAADDARHEFVLAARLITSVLLGVMVGVERRATRLNLGVRSITILALSSALVSVIATCAQVTGVTLVAAPAPFVVGAGLLAGLGLYAAARARPRAPREMGAMSVVVGLLVMMGGACGAGLSVLSAAGYLAAIGVMRGTEKVRGRGDYGGVLGEERELRVQTEDAWDGERRMVLRIGTGKNRGGTRVVEVGRRVEQERRQEFGGADFEESDFAM